MTDTGASRAGVTARAMILPLALAQFIASYAATNMNVAISAIAQDLGTSVAGVQTAITLFTLTMAALMIPGSKLTDIWGRKRCFVLSRSVSNLGSSLGTALVGSVLVAVKLPSGKPFAVALTVMLVIALIGLVLAILIPRQRVEAAPTSSPDPAPVTSQATP